MTEANQHPGHAPHGTYEDEEMTDPGDTCANQLPEELREPIDLEAQNRARNQLVAEGLGAMLQSLGPEPPHDSTAGEAPSSGPT